VYVRLLLAAFVGGALASSGVLAQQRPAYRAPQTADGHPDMQGVWATAFVTLMERPPGVTQLVVPVDQARAVAAAIRTKMPAVIDPDVQLHDIQELARVRGEYRTSLIVDPADGRIPFSKAGLEVAAAAARRYEKFDDPETRPLVERCLENLGYAPMRAVPVFLPRQIVQTADHVLIMSEDAVGLRIIRIGGRPPFDSQRSVEGYSIGRWEGDTLVVETTHFRTEDPARTVIGRPLLLGPRTRIIERFTRVSEIELLYRFTVEDADLYTSSWTGEFSLTRHDGPTYEYGCHEGNYSLPNSLRSGQAEAARQAESKSKP
jgi:hypothetical protein